MARRAGRHRHRWRLSRHIDGDDFLSRKAAEVMTQNPKIARPDQLAAEALALMTEKKITQLVRAGSGRHDKPRGHPPHP